MTTPPTPERRADADDRQAGGRDQERGDGRDVVVRVCQGAGQPNSVIAATMPAEIGWKTELGWKIGYRRFLA